MENLEQEVRILSITVSTMSGDIKELKDALLGSKLSPNAGIVGTIVDHEERLQVLENKFNRTFWIIVGLSAGSGAAAIEIIKTFFK